MSCIDRIEVHVFEFEAKNLGGVRGSGVGALGYRKGASARLSKYAVTISTSNGLRGEYVTHWVASASALGQTLMLAPYLLGREAEQREQIFDDLVQVAAQITGCPISLVSLVDAHRQWFKAKVEDAFNAMMSSVIQPVTQGGN